MTRPALHLLLAAVLVGPGAVHAQQGRVTYTVTTQLDVQLPPEMAHLEGQFPSESTDQRVLLFDESAAVTQRLASEEPEEQARDFQETEGEGVRVIVRRSGSDTEEKTHVDLATGVVTEIRDLLGREFRVVGDRPRIAWRLTGEQSEFLGLPCQKAVAQRDSTTIEAWFTPAIPASVGPETYGGLPGLILVLTDGKQTFEATDVDLSPLADGTIEVPTGGRQVTSEEFAEIVEERMRDLETMGLSNSSSGGSRVRIIRSGN